MRSRELESDEWSVLHAIIESMLPVRNAWIMRERIPARVFDRSVIPRTMLRISASSPCRCQTGRPSSFFVFDGRVSG